MVHGFFVGMHGFVEADGRGRLFRPNDLGDFIRLAVVATDDIMDKSKSDGLKKLILTLQILWFIIQFASALRRGQITLRCSQCPLL
ncbi:hypothetical protein CPB85DRAFT_843156 [Mucidula mucida]|nr:hypothetical protein CPB85DRAFT_843156 [Mucidula mucida]